MQTRNRVDSSEVRTRLSVYMYPDVNCTGSFPLKMTVGSSEETESTGKIGVVRMFCQQYVKRSAPDPVQIVKVFEARSAIKQSQTRNHSVSI